MWFEDLTRGASGHEVDVIAPPRAVRDEEDLGLTLELADARDVSSVEGGTPALLEDRVVEALAGGVVVRRARRDPVMGELLRREMGIKALRDPLGPIEFSIAVERWRSLSRRVMLTAERAVLRSAWRLLARPARSVFAGVDG